MKTLYLAIAMATLLSSIAQADCRWEFLGGGGGGSPDPISCEGWENSCSTDFYFQDGYLYKREQCTYANVVDEEANLCLVGSYGSHFIRICDERRSRPPYQN